MATVRNNGASRSNRFAAFTLIELLVVIAIIALLAAIIFPVFFTVRENARANSSMSNMHDISTKMEQYRLDNQTYPPVLFGYAVPTNPASPDGTYVSMDKALETAEGGPAGTADTYFPGLYPAYINNIATFQDGNSTAKLSDVVPVTHLTTCLGNSNPADDASCGNKGQVVLASNVATSHLYAADAYDSSPQITGANKIDTTKFIARYQLAWTDITTTGTFPTGLDNGITPAQAQTLYTRQLRWKYPPGTTYVTSTSWHVGQANKVLFLTQDGNVKKMDVDKFLSVGPDAPITDPTGNGIEATSAWRVSP